MKKNKHSPPDGWSIGVHKSGSHFLYYKNGELKEWVKLKYFYSDPKGWLLELPDSAGLSRIAFDTPLLKLYFSTLAG